MNQAHTHPSHYEPTETTLSQGTRLSVGDEFEITERQYNEDGEETGVHETYARVNKLTAHDECNCGSVYLQIDIADHVFTLDDMESMIADEVVYEDPGNGFLAYDAAF